jgi:hypothetical protein
MLSSHVGMTFAPGSVGTCQDSEGGGGCKRPSPLSSINQTRRRLTLDLSCFRTRSSDIIASSKRSLNSSLSRGSKFRIHHRSAIDPRLLRAFVNSMAMSFMQDLLKQAAPLAGGLRFIQHTKPSPSNSRSNISRFQRCERSDGASRPIHRSIGAFMRMIFCGGVLAPKGFNLPKNSVSCPITSPELRVVRQSPSGERECAAVA